MERFEDTPELFCDCPIGEEKLEVFLKNNPDCRPIQPATQMGELLLCKCGWTGTWEEQDALGTECGCCPQCGNEKLIFQSKAAARIEELEKICRATIGFCVNLRQNSECWEKHQDAGVLSALAKAALGIEEGECTKVN